MKRGIFGLLFVAASMISTQAFALFNVQVLGGQRSVKADGAGSEDVTGSELRFAAHLDPIPLVPIGFGLAFAQTTFDEDGVKTDGTDIDLEIEAWLPLEIAGLVPFAKVGYTVGGEYETKANFIAGGPESSVKYKPSGASLHVGIKYEFLLRLGIMAEVEFGSRKLEYDSSSNVPPTFVNEDIDHTSTSFLIGAQAGI